MPPTSSTRSSWSTTPTAKACSAAAAADRRPLRSPRPGRRRGRHDVEGVRRGRRLRRRVAELIEWLSNGAAVPVLLRRHAAGRGGVPCCGRDPRGVDRARRSPLGECGRVQGDDDGVGFDIGSARHRSRRSCSATSTSPGSSRAGCSTTQAVFAQAISFPTVALGKARIRVMISAAHSEQDLEDGAAAFAAVGRGFGVVA